jgi:hypothetical protein
MKAYSHRKKKAINDKTIEGLRQRNLPVLDNKYSERLRVFLRNYLSKIIIRDTKVFFEFTDRNPDNGCQDLAVGVVLRYLATGNFEAELDDSVFTRYMTNTNLF